MSALTDPVEALIHLSNLVKVYETHAGSFFALKGISLEIGYGEFVAIVGKSGSGKSTLINILTGIDRPTSGSVCISGVDITDLSETQLASWRGKNLGIVFQFFQLLPTLTVAENVRLPMDLCEMYPRQEWRERAKHLLARVEMADAADKLPSELSGGQQQRVAIARALANDPSIIVADEPTGNLDSKTARTVFDLFENLVGQGKTLLFVTHDNDLASCASRVVELSDGNLVRN
jgi:putative ABC transport system ATP-binding protein